MRRKIIILVVVTIAIIGVTLFAVPRLLSRGKLVSLESVSPDDQTRVQLLELSNFDRNFEIRVNDGSGWRTIFVSPDEGRPIGTERLLWASDSRQFLLVGKHFSVVPNCPGIAGDDAYLLYDLQTRQLKCNASQGNWARFDVAQLAPFVKSRPTTARHDEP